MKDNLIDDVGFHIRCVMVQSISVQDNIAFELG